MTKIIFCKSPNSNYTAIVPAYSEQPVVMQRMMQDLNDNSAEFGNDFHPSRCQAMGRFKQQGWILKSDKVINQRDYEQDNDPAIHLFLKHYDLDTNKYDMIKYNSDWTVYIPPGYNLLCLPVLYHTSRFYTFPGILDGEAGPHFLNLFIAMEKGSTIFPGTPLAQWILQKKEETRPEAEIRELDDKDIAAHNFKAALLVDDPDKKSYLLAKKEKMFYNPLYNQED